MRWNWQWDWGLTARRGVTAVALVTLAVGIGVWSAVLLAPTPRIAPPALVAEAGNATDLTPVAAWFGAGPASRVKIVPSGLIAAGREGSAILAVDGMRPRAFAVGQNLAHDLVLVAVLPGGVVVAQGAQETEISLPELPRVQGIVPVAAATAPTD